MIYDKIELTKIAKELKVVRDTYEKVLRLTDVLYYINTNEFLKNKLVLKGGTAINLLYTDLPRLSVDIDLDFTGDYTREEMLSHREEIDKILKKYMIVNNYKLNEKSKNYFTLSSYVFNYTNFGGNTDNIKIEINYSLRNHVLPIENITLKSINYDKEFMVSTVSKIEIYASKTVALLSRGAARDLFDVYHMITNSLISINEIDLYKKCFVFYWAIGNDYPIKTINFLTIDSLTIHKIFTDLVPVLRGHEKFDLVSVKKIVKSFLSEVIVLNDLELEFINSFNNKEYNPELLFSNKFLENIKNHPMALWKIRK